MSIKYFLYWFFSSLWVRLLTLWTVDRRALSPTAPTVFLIRWARRNSSTLTLRRHLLVSHSLIYNQQRWQELCFPNWRYCTAVCNVLWVIYIILRGHIKILQTHILIHWWPSCKAHFLRQRKDYHLENGRESAYKCNTSQGFLMPRKTSVMWKHIEDTFFTFNLIKIWRENCILIKKVTVEWKKIDKGWILSWKNLKAIILKV